MQKVDSSDAKSWLEWCKKLALVTPPPKVGTHDPTPLTLVQQKGLFKGLEGQKNWFSAKKTLSHTSKFSSCGNLCDKILLCCSQVFWPEGRFWDFLAWRRPKAFWRPKKSQKRAEGQKILAKAQNNFFVIPNGDKCLALNVEWHFFTNRTSFLLEKVSFLVQKFPIGWKEFLFGFARNKKNRARMKTRPISKKKGFYSLSSLSGFQREAPQTRQLELRRPNL